MYVHRSSYFPVAPRYLGLRCVESLRDASDIGCAVCDSPTLRVFHTALRLCALRAYSLSEAIRESGEPPYPLQNLKLQTTAWRSLKYSILSKMLFNALKINCLS